MFLSRIEIFPIKSLDGIVLDEAVLTAGGILEHDRAHAIFDADGRVINGKRTPHVHQLRCTFDTAIREVRLREDGRADAAQFALDDLAGISRWMSDFFAMPAVLRREPEKGFPDDREAFGPTIVSEASLRVVQEWYPELTFESARRRFRSNLELSGGPAFCEDELYGAPGELKPFTIGPVHFFGHNPCQRCVVPTRDPETGQPVAEFQKKFMRRRQESLPKWANATRFNHFYRFAVNTSVPPSEAGKRLRTGDFVTI